MTYYVVAVRKQMNGRIESECEGDKKRSSPNGEALKLFLQEHTVKGGDSEHLLVCRKE